MVQPSCLPGKSVDVTHERMLRESNSRRTQELMDALIVLSLALFDHP